MAAPVIEALRVTVEKTVGVVDSAIVFIKGEAARLSAAVAKALENGATEAELAPVIEEVALLNAKADELAAAIAA